MKPETRHSTIDEYVRNGWRIEETDEHSISTEPYSIHSPDGCIYWPHDLIFGCSYCEESDEYCMHDEELLAREREAKHLCGLIENQHRAEFHRWTFKSDHE